MRHALLSAGGGLPYENGVLPACRVLLFPALLLTALLLGALLSAPTPAHAAEGLVLRNFVLDNQQGNMTVRFSLDLEGEQSLDEVRVALLEGETLVLECRAELSRRRGYWLDKGLAQGMLVNFLRADRDFDSYVLAQENGEEYRSTSLKELLEVAWRNMTISMGAFSLLQRRETYSVELDVALKQYEVPAWKRWTMFFRSFEVVTGARYQMDFEY